MPLGTVVAYSLDLLFSKVYLVVESVWSSAKTKRAAAAGQSTSWRREFRVVIVTRVRDNESSDNPPRRHQAADLAVDLEIRPPLNQPSISPQSVESADSAVGSSGY